MSTTWTDRLGRGAVLWIAVLLVPILLAACRSEAPKREAPAPVAAKVIAASGAPGRSFRTVPGVVRSETTSPLSARMVGNVRRVLVAEGDRVRSGQLLLEIDGRELAAAARQGSAGRDQAESALGAAGAAVSAAEAEANLAEATLRRYSALAERGSVSGQELDAVRARRDGAAAQAEQARQRRAEALAGREGARAAADRSTAVADDAEIRSPIDGIVTVRSVDPGAQVAPGMPLLVVEDSRASRVEVTVDESLPVVAGQAVEIELDGTTVAARVTRVQPSVDPSAGTSLVKIALPKPARSGTLARVRFGGAARAEVRVPATAIGRRGALRFVFVVGEDRVARMRLVTLGEERQGSVEVLTGLVAGEGVVEGSPAGLRDGVPVTPVQG